MSKKFSVVYEGIHEIAVDVFDAYEEACAYLKQVAEEEVAYAFEVFAGSDVRYEIDEDYAEIESVFDGSKVVLSIASTTTIH